nr:unnamed protein product [Digitaria exilis]
MTPLLLLRLLCLLPLATAAAAAATLPADFAALIAAKTSLSDPTSALAAWDPHLSPSPCRWPHLLCSVPDAPAAVASLLLSNLSLAGDFPSPLCSLRSLSELDLSYNSLTGPLPPCLAALPSLRRLDLSGNAFSGEVPAAYGAGFPSLATLGLAGNELSGAFLGHLLNVTTLEELLLAYNPFAPSSLTPASFSALPRLRVLWLAGCGLVGEIPASVGSLKSLVNLDLSTNNLTGEIPATVARLENAVQIELYSNHLTGRVPDGLGELKRLRFFDASMNRLTGEIPADLLLAPRLESLHIYQNELSGRVPATLAQAAALADLRLFSNRLTGELPPEFGKNCPLEFLDLSDNRISGRIPAALCSAGKLEQVLILNNELVGPIPAELGQCRTLTRVRLPNNQLSGAVPPDMWGLPHLYLLELSGNRLSGTVGPAIAMATNLSQLLISDNRFTGSLPEQIGSLPALFELSAANNISQSRASRRGLVGSVTSILAVAGVVLLLGVAWFCYTYRSQHNHGRSTAELSNGGGGSRPRWALTSFHKIEFDEEDILGCLDEDNVVGMGAAGKVYKAVVLGRGAGEDAITVAVKKLWGGAGGKGKAISAAAAKDSFDAEVATLGRIRHKNIVRLWCCFRSGDDCRLLVYEFMPNGSLGDLLHGGGKGVLDWPARHRIMAGAAEGLAYLHHDCVPPIVHRDVKSNNILLDADLGAKVADFGVARVITGDGPSAVSAIAGSCGYIAPEYSYTLRVTEKSDVYSFGVVMLELVTGKRPVAPELGDKDLVRWVHGSIERGGVDSVLDPRLAGKSRDDMVRALHIALLCTSSLPINRPSMRAVVKLLAEAAPPPPSPPPPAKVAGQKPPDV